MASAPDGAAAPVRVNLLRAHGSPTGYLYGHRGCRCVCCRGANAEYRRRHRRAHAAEVAEYSRRWRAAHAVEVAEYKRRWSEKHREEIAEYQRRHRAEHREYSRRYYAEHREEEAARKRRWHREHREEEAARNHKYRQEHPEERAARSRRRRARKYAAPGSHTAADIRAQYERQGGYCYWSIKLPGRRHRAERDGQAYHVDHVIPLVLGGSDGPENLVITCYKCNLSKHAKHPMEFAGVLL